MHEDENEEGKRERKRMVRLTDKGVNDYNKKKGKDRDSWVQCRKKCFWEATKLSRWVRISVRLLV